jgi:mycothiol synthase
LAPDLVRGIELLAAEVASFDGVAALSEASLLALPGDGDGNGNRNGSAEVVHLTLADDRLVGYAQLRREGTEFGPAELLVHPDARDRGRGTALLAAALAEGAAGAWAHGQLPAAMAVGAAAGLVVERTLLLLSREVAGLPTAGPAPAGFAIRGYRGDVDDTALLGVNSRAFVELPDQGSWSYSDLRARMGEPWFDPAGLLLLTAPVETPGNGDHVVGFHWTKATSATEGEVYVIAVDPAWHGHGLGRYLLLVGLDRLRDVGVGLVSLYCDGANSAALRLYESLGFQVERTDVVLARTGQHPASAAPRGPASGRLGA